jgi:hypothetical protein
MTQMNADKNQKMKLEPGFEEALKKSASICVIGGQINWGIE